MLVSCQSWQKITMIQELQYIEKARGMNDYAQWSQLTNRYRLRRRKNWRRSWRKDTRDCNANIILGTSDWIDSMIEELALKCSCSTRCCQHLYVSSNHITCDIDVTNLYLYTRRLLRRRLSDSLVHRCQFAISTRSDSTIMTTLRISILELFLPNHFVLLQTILERSSKLSRLIDHSVIECFAFWWSMFFQKTLTKRGRVAQPTMICFSRFELSLMFMMKLNHMWRKITKISNQASL